MSVMELDLSSPAEVMVRLDAIERDLALRQNGFEAAARCWYTAKRNVEKKKAQALLEADANTVAEKRARAEIEAYDVADAGSEAEYEAIKAVVRVLETRATVLQSLLRAQGRIA